MSLTHLRSGLKSKRRRHLSEHCKLLHRSGRAGGAKHSFLHVHSFIHSLVRWFNKCVSSSSHGQVLFWALGIKQ